MQHLDDLWAALNDGSTNNGSASYGSADKGARFLVQYLDHLDGGGSMTVVVDGSGSWATAARDDLHLVDLWGRSIAVTAGIATAGVSTAGVATAGVAAA